MQTVILHNMLEIRCVVSGSVQGVGYRDYVSVSAGQCCVTGWIYNKPDGSVEVCAQGKPNNLKDFIEYLHEGSVMSRVEDVAVEWIEPQDLYDDFSIWRSM